MDVLVSPLEVMNDPLVCQLLFHNEYILEEVHDSLFDVKVIELCNHGLLVLEILLILIDQGVPLINDTSYVVEDRSVSASLKLS